MVEETAKEVIGIVAAMECPFERRKARGIQWMQLELFVYEGHGSQRDWVTLVMPPPYGWIGVSSRKVA